MGSITACAQKTAGRPGRAGRRPSAGRQLGAGLGTRCWLAGTAAPPASGQQGGGDPSAAAAAPLVRPPAKPMARGACARATLFLLTAVSSTTDTWRKCTSGERVGPGRREPGWDSGALRRAGPRTHTRQRAAAHQHERHHDLSHHGVAGADACRVVAAPSEPGTAGQLVRRRAAAVARPDCRASPACACSLAARSTTRDAEPAQRVSPGAMALEPSAEAPLLGTVAKRKEDPRIAPTTCLEGRQAGRHMAARYVSGTPRRHQGHGVGAGRSAAGMQRR